MKLLLLGISLIALARADIAPLLSLVPATGISARPGETVLLTLNLSNTSVAALQFELQPPTGVSSLILTPSAVLTTAAKTLSCAALPSGITRCVIAGLNANFIIGNLATVAATVAPSSPQGNMSMIPTAIIGVSAEGSTVPVSAAGSTWSVTVPFDLSGDGAVDATDLNIVVDQILGELPCGTADFNHDGVCNLLDASLLITAALTPPPSTIPSITSLTPSVGAGGQVVNVTLGGTGFVAGAQVKVEGTVVTVSNIQVLSQTTITATFSIKTGAAPRARNVTVTTPGGTSNPVPFVVQ